MRQFGAGLLAGAALGAGLALWLTRRRRSLLGRFLSHAAHELNTPITAVSMTLSNFTNGAFGEVPAAQLPWLELAREQMGRLGGLVGELRDLVLLELGRPLPLYLEEEQPAEAAELALKALSFGCSQAGIELVSEVEPGLPALRADADRLHRCLTNLLYHARKFRRKGPIRL